MSFSRKLYRIVLVVATLVLIVPQGAELQEAPRHEFFGLINQIRLDEGLPPLGWSTLLTQAAQGHAEDIAGRGTASHEGSDGSGYRQRIREAGYRAWNDGLMVYETVWMGLGNAEDAVNWFYNNAEQWDAFVDPRYREIGVGFIRDDQGVNYFVVNFGSRPGVLPIFINDGAEATDSPQVAVRLTNENAVPLGEGSWMGKAIEVRMSNTAEFEGIEWQPWEPLLPWVLEGRELGSYAVYVEFRDGADRITIAEDTIRLLEPGTSPPTPTPYREASEPSGQTPTLLPTEVPAPAQTLELTPQTIEPTSVPELTTPAPERQATPPAVDAAPVPTWTPLPAPAGVPGSNASQPRDWPLLAAFLLQGTALVLGAAVFLRRQGE